MTTWGMRKTVGVVAVAAAIAGVGGAAIAAATETGYHAASGAFGGFSGFGGFGGPPSSAHHTDVEPDSVHGESVVADGHGGFSTLLTQTGRVTAISATAVTARSDDGFRETYVIREADGASKPPFAIGDRITINAKREGETATVTTMRPSLSAGH